MSHVLEDLWTATRLRARSGVWGEPGVSHLECSRSGEGRRSASGLFTLPGHATALGKAILAHAPPAVVRTVIARGLLSYTRHTVVTEWQLQHALAAVGRSGVALSPGSRTTTSARSRFRCSVRTGWSSARSNCGPDERRPELERDGGHRMTQANGRRLLRLEARNSATPIEHEAPSIPTRVRTGPRYAGLKALVRDGGLHTVCERAGCPHHLRVLGGRSGMPTLPSGSGGDAGSGVHQTGTATVEGGTAG